MSDEDATYTGPTIEELTARLDGKQPVPIADVRAAIIAAGGDMPMPRSKEHALELMAADLGLDVGTTAAIVDQVTRRAGRRSPVGRNEPCPCGSGRKFKHCHGGTA